MRVLVTGFGPFAKFRRNPTEGLARRADGLVLGRARVSGRVLDTEFRRSARQLRAAIHACRPDVLLMFGLAAGSKKLGLEAVALNVDHAEVPDNAGARPRRRPIDPGGPLALESALPLDALLRALGRGRIPARISHHAGTYVCNHLFYSARRMAPRLPAGFIHVPKGWPEARLDRALRLLVETVARGRGRS